MVKQDETIVVVGVVSLIAPLVMPIELIISTSHPIELHQLGFQSLIHFFSFFLFFQAIQESTNWAVSMLTGDRYQTRPDKRLSSSLIVELDLVIFPEYCR